MRQSALTMRSGKNGVSDGTPIVHTYASFNFSKKKGKYMTSYNSPPLMTGV